MPRRKRCSPASATYDPFDDDDFDDDACSQSSKSGNPPQRNAANARERARMRILSSAFGQLKTKLPNIPPDTKLSKLDTLRLATMYIKQLKTLVESGSTCGVGTGDGSVANSENMLAGLELEESGIFNFQHAAAASMSWPFGFHNLAGNAASASRQLQFQYSAAAAMEWSHAPPETHPLVAGAKYPRRSSDSTTSSPPTAAASGNYQPHSLSHNASPPQPVPWYVEMQPQPAAGSTDLSNSHCAYAASASASLQMATQQQQHQRLQHFQQQL